MYCMYKRSAQILLLLIPLLTSINNQSSLAQDPDPGIPDSVRVSSGTGTPGSQVVLNVTGFNDEELAGVLVPLKFPSSFLVADSISYLGSRLASASIKPFSIDTAANTLSFGAVYFGTPLDTGNGLLARIYFTVKPGALPETVSIDTINNPPSVLSFSDPAANEWVPQFKPGKIIIQLFNPAPVWQKIANQSVLEGDSLKIMLNAKDPSGDPLTFAALNGPPGSRVNKLSDSTALFTWVPDFIGPYSSSGSPFKVTFVVSDGANFIRQDVAIYVINKNQLPILVVPGTQTVTPANNLTFQVSASDPDQEAVTLTAKQLPSGAAFNNQNPGTFNWTPGLNQAGLHFAIFEAKDEVGGARLDTVTIIVSVDYVLDIIDDTAYPGGTAVIKISLTNVDSVAAFSLLIHYDQTVLTLQQVSRDTTRISNWEFFTYRENPDGVAGDLLFVGLADKPNPILTPPLPEGSGTLIELGFQVANDPFLGGISIPVTFKFREGHQDNTLSSPDGRLITRDKISYSDGRVNVLQPSRVILSNQTLLLNDTVELPDQVAPAAENTEKENEK